MQLTRFTDYCLRVLMYLSYKQDLATIAELAHGYRISENHLMKVVHHLSRKGYIETLRGKGGGMRLAREPADINLAAVIEDCEDSQGVIECLSADYDGSCPLMPQCELRRALRGAQKAFIDHLKQYSLQDLVTNKQVQRVLASDRFGDVR